MVRALKKISFKDIVTDHVAYRFGIDYENSGERQGIEG